MLLLPALFIPFHFLCCLMFMITFDQISLPSSPAHVKWTIPLQPELNQVCCDQCVRPLGQRNTSAFPISTTYNAKDSVYTHSIFTFPGSLLFVVQVFAAEVTLRKHSCFSQICRHRTTPPVLIFNKDETFISQWQSVRAWWLQEHKEEINSTDCFLGVIYWTLLSTGLQQWQITDEESLCPYQWVVSGCYDKVKCILLTHATWHTSHEWPQSVINHPSPRSHQGRHNSGAHSLSSEPEPDPQRPVYFPCSSIGRQCFSISLLISIEITNHSSPHIWDSHNWQWY